MPWGDASALNRRAAAPLIQFFLGPFLANLIGIIGRAWGESPRGLSRGSGHAAQSPRDRALPRSEARVPVPSRPRSRRDVATGGDWPRGCRVTGDGGSRVAVAAGLVGPGGAGGPGNARFRNASFRLWRAHRREPAKKPTRPMAALGLVGPGGPDCCKF